MDIRLIKAFTLILVLTGALSCSKESTVSYDAGDGEIVFTEQGLDLETKASVVTSMSSFNVICVTGVAGTSESTVFNRTFNGSGGNYTGGKYWPVTDAGYKFYASNLALTPAATGPTVAASAENDAVCAFLPLPTFRSTNALTFNHIFARVGYCNITAPATYTVSNLSVKITPKVSGTYNLFKGYGKTDGTGWSATANGTEKTLTTSLNSTANNDLWLVPGTYTLTATYTLTKGAYVESFTKYTTVSMVAGKVNNISSTLPQGNAQELTFTLSLDNWGTNSISVNIN